MHATIRAEAQANRLDGNRSGKPPTRGTTGEAVVKPTPIASFPDCWDTIHRELEGMVKGAITPDRFDDAKSKKKLLEVQDANIKTTRGLLDKLQEAIAKTLKELEAYIAEPKKVEANGWLNPDSPRARQIRRTAIEKAKARQAATSKLAIAK